MAFQPHETVQAQTVVKVRRSPGLAAKPGDDVLGMVAAGAAAVILGAAQIADGLTWWPLRCTLLDGATVDGWCAESDGQQVLLAPASATPGAGFVVGEQVTVVAPYPINVRASAGHIDKPAEDVVATVFGGSEFTVQGGPATADGLTWWQVAGAAGSGWVADAGTDGTRFLAPTALRASIVVGKPFQGEGAVSQWWGGNAALYATVTYDGVPLRGHNGIDFGLVIGTPLVAVDGGRVKRATFDESGFGHFVLLEHSWGESLYAHMTERAVSEGDTVQAGQFLGPSGNSGMSYGPHLHFGIRITPYCRTDGWGGFCDPKPFMDSAHLVQSRAPARPSPLGPERPDMPRP